MDEYYVDGKQIVSLESVKADGQEYKVRSRKVVTPYDAYGHTYTAVSKHYYVDIVALGVTIPLDLNLIVPNKDITAVNFTLAF